MQAGFRRYILVQPSSQGSAALVNFDLSQDEEMLKALAQRFVTDRYNAEKRRAYLASECGFSSDNWALLCELGFIAAPFAAVNGGLGLDSTGLATIFEALGYGLFVEPLIENVVLAGLLFERLVDGQHHAALLGSLVSGDKRIALAHRETAARRNPNWVETTVRQNGTGVSLTGTKSLIPAGAGVDCYLVTARTSGKAGDADGVSIYLVDARAPRLTVNQWRLVDGGAAVSLQLDNVLVEQSDCLGGTLAEVEIAQTRASLVRSAEALGIMDRLFAETLDYLKTRTQFGAPIGSFQAIQHRMVAQYAAIEQSRALLTLAVMANPTDTRAWISAVEGARAFISAASVTLGHEMIQFHGGMGVTGELSIGQGHRRLLMLSRWPDDPQTALDRFAAA